ncbi:hypothetical protein AAFF_G00436480 [Aldrovandia affinis]|uniref:Uncharacterized protein n=1 Tax=Aldrovandia affinis TaxID=143900 RepID=A0AAD7WIU8_9TELE|nr:hypothetical protein AAFF_G00436480 [Aldrovandia affinis]
MQTCLRKDTSHFVWRVRREQAEHMWLVRDVEVSYAGSNRPEAGSVGGREGLALDVTGWLGRAVKGRGLRSNPGRMWGRGEAPGGRIRGCEEDAEHQVH